ncbi:hypothetical protein ADUPG1_012921 [Aduncisulcus paluster]|uniref:Recombination activating protein 2 n=1 Tax=Aduncisulcus paluster TaxID=2918883 RepID=A0ABQ5K4T8_9EUKA|nr:hypothetical protein ADUPG1_012921 [Aduncisulcus paluster]
MLDSANRLVRTSLTRQIEVHGRDSLERAKIFLRCFHCRIGLGQRQSYKHSELWNVNALCCSCSNFEDDPRIRVICAHTSTSPRVEHVGFLLVSEQVMIFCDTDTAETLSQATVLEIYSDYNEVVRASHSQKGQCGALIPSAAGILCDKSSCVDSSTPPSGGNIPEGYEDYGFGYDYGDPSDEHQELIQLVDKSSLEHPISVLTRMIGTMSHLGCEIFRDALLIDSSVHEVAMIDELRILNSRKICADIICHETTILESGMFCEDCIIFGGLQNLIAHSPQRAAFSGTPHGGKTPCHIYDASDLSLHLVQAGKKKRSHPVGDRVGDRVNLFNGKGISISPYRHMWPDFAIVLFLK